MSYSDDVVEIPVAENRPGPSCGREIPFYREFVPWCSHCGWGLKPDRPDEDDNGRMARFYRWLGERSGQRIFDDLAAAPSIRSTLGPERVLAYLLAALLHGLALGLLAAGLVMLFAARSNFFALVIALPCLGLAWLARPRFGRLGKDEQIAPRAEFPTLYALADRIADALGAPRLHGIVIDDAFNASFGRIGWRQQPLMRLGLPLLASLNEQEQVAVMAHELGHSVNGDSMRGLFVGSACNTLVHWHHVTKPEALWASDAGLLGIITIPVNLALAGLSQLLWFWAAGMIYLLWRDSQRAEYLADDLGAQVAGTSASVGLLEALHNRAYFVQTLRRMALRRLEKLDFWAQLRKQIAVVPESERERVRRVARLAGSRLYLDHPPTGKRIEMVKRHPVSEPKVTISPAEADRLAGEMLPLEQGIQKRLFGYFGRY